MGSGYSITRPTKYCHACGGVIDAMAVVCPKCGVMQGGLTLYGSEKRILPAFLLCFTLGGLGIWTLIDMVMIVTGSFKDSEGEKLVDWT